MIKEIIQDFKEFAIWLNNWFFYRKHSIKLKLAVQLANMKQRAFNKRYFVLLVDVRKGNKIVEKLVSINKEEFKVCKRKKWLPKNMSYLDLSESCFYQTPLSLNNSFSREDMKKAKEKYLKYAEKMYKK